MPSSTTTARGDSTRLALVQAAERLFASRGIANTSVAAVTKAAGQKNNYAIGWHFGGKDELLIALLARHQAPIDRTRAMILDAVEAGGAVDSRSIAHALVAPLADRLRQPDGGAAYLRIQAEIQAGRSEVSADDLAEQAPQPAARRLTALAGRHLHYRDDAPVDDIMALMVTIVFHGLADFATRHPDADADHIARFEQLLIDTVTDLLDRHTEPTLD